VEGVDGIGRGELDPALLVDHHEAVAHPGDSSVPTSSSGKGKADSATIAAKRS